MEAVKSLVPEAQVYEHRILHSIQGNQLHADDLRHPDAQEDHSSQAPEDGAAGENEEPLRLGGQQPTSQGRPAAGSVTSVGNLDFSSQTWIEMEALDLLGRLQKHTAHDTAFGSNLLLAGYGLGGIIIKQVSFTSALQRPLCSLIHRHPRPSLLPTPHQDSTISRSRWSALFFFLHHTARAPVWDGKRSC